MAERTCVVCEGPLSGRQTLLCSKRCQITRANRQRLSDPERRQRHYEARRHLVDQYRADGRDAQWKEASRRKGVCRRCGKPARLDAEWCSHACASPVYRKYRVQRLAEGTVVHLGGVVTYGPCAECGQVFTSFASGPAKYCSRKCKSRVHTRMRSRRIRSTTKAAVRRYEIHERDGWQCCLCGIPVDRSQSHPHPLAPVLDHVVPLCQGGEHSPSNVQTAHSLCNAWKGGGTPS